MKRYTQQEIEELRNKYVPGIRIKLIFMDDVQRPDSGTVGTVVGVDDIGSIHMKWDNGSSLAIVPDEDEFEIVEDEK